jgi:hypothetical protein
MLVEFIRRVISVLSNVSFQRIMVEMANKENI